MRIDWRTPSEMKKLRTGFGSMGDVNHQTNVAQAASGARNQSTPSPFAVSSRFGGREMKLRCVAES